MFRSSPSAISIKAGLGDIGGQARHLLQQFGLGGRRAQAGG